MDTANKIYSFEEVGMTDPFKTEESLATARCLACELDIDKLIYGERIMRPIIEAISKGRQEPPIEVFLPSR